ncbi:MAG: hypothetical protein ACTSRP_02475 [Candidatus Helarchaeota archaeon]
MKIRHKKMTAIFLTTLVILSLVFGIISLIGSNFQNSQQQINDYNENLLQNELISTWENYTKWRYRINITLANSLSIDIVNMPINFYTNFSENTCLNNSLRLYKGLPPTSTEIPIQVWNTSYYTGTEFLNQCTITFLVNLTSGEKSNYYLYYSNDADLTTDTIETFQPPAYPSKISSQFDGNTVSIENNKYYIEFEEGKGIYNFTIKEWGENVHSDYSLSPDPYNLKSQNSQYVLVRPGEYLLFIAYEDNTNVTLYDAISGIRLDKLSNPLSTDISSCEIDQYDTWRYPSQTFSFSNSMMVRIDYTKPVSLFVTSIGVNRDPGKSGITNNYYSGTDHLSDDDLYSAYGQDLLLWIPRDCWITAYEPNTKVVITDINTDGDSDDSRTLILGTGANWWENCCWNTTRDPLVYTANRSKPGNYYDFTPYGDPSGDDYLNPEIFDNDIVRIQANSCITVVAGRPANDYQTEIYGKDQKQFYFPIMYRFRITAIEDNTKVYWRNLTHGPVDMDNTYGGYDPGDIYSYQGSYPLYTDYIANAYITYFSDYNSRHQLTDAEVAQGWIYLNKGDTIEFYDWPPDYTVNYGTPYAARAEDPSESTYHTIYDRWNSAPDFYKNNWANVTATKPIKLYVGYFGSSSYSGSSGQKYGQVHYFSSSHSTQYLSLGALENNTEITIESSEGETDQHTTILEASDLNGDGIEEIIVGSTVIALYNGTNGEKIWEYPIWSPYGGGMERYGWDDWRWLSQIYTEDMNGDSYKDIIITAAGATFNILVLNGKNGRPLWYKADSSYYPLDTAFGDITGDGIPDIVYIEGPGYGYGCYALDGKTGNYLWRHYMGYLGWAFEVELMDIDDDNFYEMMVFGLTNDYIYTYNTTKLINTSYWSQSGSLPGYNTLGWRRVIFDDNRPQYDEDGGWYDRVTMNQILTSRIADANGYDLRVLKVGELNASSPGPEIVIGTGRANYYNGNFTFVAAVNYTLSNIYQNGRIGNEYQPALGGKALWVTSINPYTPPSASNDYDYHWVRYIALGDLDNDSLDDVIVGLGEYEDSWSSHQSYEDNITLYAYSGLTGDLLWESDEITDTIWDIKLYDYNSDGQLDVLTAIRGERNNYKPWYIYNGFSGNITLVNGSNGKVIWYKNINDGTNYRWVRYVSAGNLTGGTHLDLLAGTYSNNESFYVYRYNGSTWNRVSWKTQLLPTKSFKDNLLLNSGEIVRVAISDDYRGVILNSTKPILIYDSANDISEYESIMWVPTIKRNSIASITKLDEGPIFVKYEVEWTNNYGLHTTDIMTFYAGTSYWNLKRIQYWDNIYEAPYVVLNTYYSLNDFHNFNFSSIDLITDINEATFDGGKDLFTGLDSSEYAAIVHSLNDNENLSLGIYMTDYDYDQFMTCSAINLNNQYNIHSELAEFKLIPAGFLTPGGSSYKLSFNLWEYAEFNMKASDLREFDNMFNNNFISGYSQSEIWYTISIRVLNYENAPISGANITIYNKTLYTQLGAVSAAKIASEIVGEDGCSKTFTKILEGEYTIIATLPSDKFLEYAGPDIKTVKNITVNSTNKQFQINLNVISLDITTLYKSHLTTLDYIPSEDLFINSKICIYNSSDGSSIANQTTDYNGNAVFYLVPSIPGNWNYTLRINAYGEWFDPAIVEKLSQGIFNYTSSGIWQSPLVVVGNEAGGTPDNVNKLDNTTYNVTSEAGSNQTVVEFYFNLSSINQPVDSVKIYYRGKLFELASIAAKLQLYNVITSTWDDVYDINTNNTWAQYAEYFSNDYVDSSSDNLVKVRITVESNKPTLTMIDYLVCEFITLTGNEHKNELNITLTSSTSLILNCTGRAPIYTYLNVAYPNESKAIYSVDYLSSFNLMLFYNASEKYPNGLPDSQSEIIAVVKDQTSGITELTCTKANGKIVFNGTQGYYLLNISPVILNAGDYIVSINATYPGYTPTSLSFILRVNSLSTSLQIMKNGAEISKVSVYWNTSIELNISYMYSQQKLTDWTLSWQIIQYSTLSGSINVSNNMYELSISTGLLDTTTYTLQISANKSNYDPVQVSITVEVLEIPTKLNGTDFQYPTIQVYAMESKIVYFKLTDNLTGEGVEEAITSYSIDPTKESGYLQDLGNGLYMLNVSTETKPVGKYVIVIHIKKNRYSEVPCVVFLEIQKRPTSFDLITPQTVEVEQGKQTTFKFNLTDLLNGEGLNFTVQYSWKYGSGQLEYLGDGVYQLVLPTEGIPRGSYTITISCSTDNWTIQTMTISVTVTWVKIFGIEMPYFLALILAVVASVVIFSMYLIVKRASIPEPVRKINATIKGIKSKKKELSVPITKSKSALFIERYKNAWAILKLNPPILQSKYLVDYVADIIGKYKPIKMSLPEVEKLVNKIKSLGTAEIRMTLEDMGFPPEVIDLIIKAIQTYGSAA